jgi:hypothetical protein
MLHRAEQNVSAWPGHTEKDPVQKIHQHLVWALGTATIVLILNAVVVVLVGGGG